MSEVNRVILLGKLQKVPKLGRFPSGKPFLKLKLSTTSPRGEKKAVIHSHNIAVFGTQAEICARYLKQGSLVMVEGNLEVEACKKRVGSSDTIRVVASRVQFLGGRSLDRGATSLKSIEKSGKERAPSSGG